MSALPDVIDSLVGAAKAGDVAAAKYLLDRVFGRVQLQSAAIADDVSIPFSDADFERETKTKEFRDSISW
jgi:hypothetical protein